MILDQFGRPVRPTAQLTIPDALREATALMVRNNLAFYSKIEAMARVDALRASVGADGAPLRGSTIEVKLPVTYALKVEQEDAAKCARVDL